MHRVFRLAAWPLTLKIPLLVASLMVGAAALISQVVLARLVQDQETNLNMLTSAYLDGLSASILPATVRADVWEVFDALDRSRTRYTGVEARYAIVELPNGTVLAASDPRRFPVQSALPPALRERFPHDDGIRIDNKKGLAWLSRTLREEGVSVGRVLAEIDIADLLRVRRQVLMTLIFVNGALTILFAAGGYLAVKHMLQPLGVLNRYVEQVRDGRVEPIPQSHRKIFSGEFDRIFVRFNAMAQALNDRETLASQLAEQEKYAMLGRLASGMAHEVNNPLGGMMNAVDTLQVHGADPAVRQKSVEFLKRGLAGIRNVVRAALVTYKGGRDATVLVPSDLDDLPFLVQHETGARRLRLSWRNEITEPLPVEGAAIRQITLNLLLNACAASPAGGTVGFEASCEMDSIRIAVSDEGPGLPAEMAALLSEANSRVSPPQASNGLGLWTTARLVHRLEGRIDVGPPSKGTLVSVTVPLAAKRPCHGAA